MALHKSAVTAPRIGVTVGTLQNWRLDGKGPPFIKAGRSVLYDDADIEAWKAANRFRSTSEADEAARQSEAA